jgi:hypothetical protein
MLQIPDNQEAISEMARVNPLFHEGRFKELRLDFLHPESVEARMNWRRQEVTLERWQERAQQERRAEDVQSGIQVWADGGRVLTIPVPNRPRTTGVQRPAQQPLQNLGQWMRDIEADEQRRMEETPMQRRTRERRELIELCVY